MADQLLTLPQKREYLQKASNHIYDCLMATAWDWNGQPVEIVRESYSTYLQEALKLIIPNQLSSRNLEKELIALLDVIEGIENLDNTGKTQIMKTCHYVAKDIYNTLQEDIKEIERKHNILMG
jgi:uncharacterized protein YwgA